MLNVLLGLLFLLAAVQGWAGFWADPAERLAFEDRVWEYRVEDFGDGAYREGVEALFAHFEMRTSKSLGPGEKRRAGIKVFTASGSGIATPPPLVRGVVAALRKRGFSNEELFILDLNEGMLRHSGFVPPLSRWAEGSFFEGVPVYALESGRYYDEEWFYESALPSKAFQRQLKAELLEADGEERKSFLSAPLLKEVDFWINLPVGIADPVTGVTGALVNASLLNISNGKRFFSSASNAPVAAAEVAAIPELAQHWALTLLSLERYQFIGGPAFHSLYTESEPLLWLSTNPVLLDALMLQRMNVQREREGFDSIEEMLPLLRFAESLGLGSQSPGSLRWKRLP